MSHHPLPELAVIVWEEIKSGNISEGYIYDPKFYVAGLTEGNRITLNPIPDKADAAIHEALHRHFKHWSEAYVRQRTEALFRHLGDDGIRRICRLCDRVKKTRARTKKTENGYPIGRLTS